MTGRSHYLPRASVLEKMGEYDRAQVLDYHLRQLEEEIDGLKSGYIYVTDGKGRAHQLRLVRARMRRLVALAQSFGFWLEEKEAA